MAAASASAAATPWKHDRTEEAAISGRRRRRRPKNSRSADQKDHSTCLFARNAKNRTGEKNIQARQKHQKKKMFLFSQKKLEKAPLIWRLRAAIALISSIFSSIFFFILIFRTVSAAGVNELSRKGEKKSLFLFKRQLIFFHFWTRNKWALDTRG